MIFAGIDPGLKGAWALVNRHGRVVKHGDLPVVGKRVDVGEWQSLWGTVVANARKVAVERVQVRSRQRSAVVGAVNYGRLLAGLELHGVEYVEIQASVWKQGMGLAARRGEKLTDKERKARSMALCAEVFPDFKPKRHDQAEAALLAEWLRRTS